MRGIHLPRELVDRARRVDELCGSAFFLISLLSIYKVKSNTSMMKTGNAKSMQNESLTKTKLAASSSSHANESNAHQNINGGNIPSRRCLSLSSYDLFVFMHQMLCNLLPARTMARTHLILMICSAAKSSSLSCSLTSRPLL